MKKLSLLTAIMAVTGVFLPLFSQAEGLANDIHGLQSVLDGVYNDMLSMCSNLVGVGQGIAGFGALWYIAARVYRQIANAEPLDFYPLMRPFGLGLAIMLFPAVIGLINGIMQPTVSATGNMVQNSDAAIARLLQAKQDAVEKTDAWQAYVGQSGSGDENRWYKYTHPEDDSGDGNSGMINSIGNSIKFEMAKASYNFRNTIKEWMSEILQVCYEAAALCINTIRTFYLIVLAILGPLVLGLSVFDGFQHVLTSWLAKYINVFLWLPVANIFGTIIGKVQENMLQLDISQVQNAGDTFFSSTDTAYLIFLLIGIIGYFTVPSVANYIVNAGGGHGLLQKVNTMVISTTNTAVNAGGAMGDRMGTGATNLYNAPKDFMSGYNGNGGSKDNYQAQKLSSK